ncbi:hypothetical protein IKG73_00555 [Candidatus Saccharibacteria bacterium]|nr:hypothetical protein [Candidatus Saccharibacteria bacterium]
MYDKVVLVNDEAHKLYREDLILGEDGRIVFRKRRRFQEFLGASSFEDSSCIITKGPWVKFGLELPGYIPVREPLQNWFQVAMHSGVDFRDPLGLEARYKGFLPVRLTLDAPRLLQERTGMIVMEDDPCFEFTDYLLLIYDRANYNSFIYEVQSLLERRLRTSFGRVVRDIEGNTIMVSDSVTDQAMMLMPIDLLPGGKDYVSQKWKEVIEI